MYGVEWWDTMPFWNALIGACNPLCHSAPYVVCNEMVQCVCKETLYLSIFHSLSDAGIVYILYTLNTDTPFSYDFCWKMLKWR